MSATEETTPNIVGRARRSAAASSKRAWAALLPGKKSSFSDVETESVPDNDDKAERKDSETPKSQTPVETVSQKRARVGGKRSRTNKDPAENLTPAMLKESPQPDNRQPSQTKSPTKKLPQSPARSPSSPKPQQASVRIRPSHKALMSTGSNSALNSDQLRDIEREIDKHLEGGLDNGNFEEDEDDEMTKRFILDDKNDEDYQLKEKKPAKRSAILKAPATRVASNSSEQALERGSTNRGRGRGRGRPGIAGGIMRGRQNGPARGAMTGAGSPSSQINVRPTVDHGMTGMPPTRRDFEMGGRAPPKVVIMKPRDPQNRNSLYTQGSALPQAPVNTTTMDKEIGELAEKYKNTVVSGSTVQEFSNIVNQILQELNRLQNDNRRLIDYNQRCIDQLKISHATQMDLKEERIRQLEQTVEILQANFLQSRKQMQLNTLKYEIAGKPENPSAVKIQNGQKPGSPAVVNPSSSANAEFQMNKAILSRSMLERDESEPNNKVPRQTYMPVSKTKVYPGYHNPPDYEDDDYDSNDEEMDNEYDSDEHEPTISTSRQLTL